MAEMYAEYGVIGVVVILFSGMLYWFRGFVERLVNNKLEDLENEIQQNREIMIKLIDRWNKETTKADRRHESVIENAERRHEKLTFELRTQSESLNFLRGKLDKAWKKSRKQGLVMEEEQKENIKVIAGKAEGKDETIWSR